MAGHSKSRVMEVRLWSTKGLAVKCLASQDAVQQRMNSKQVEEVRRRGKLLG